MSKIIKRSYSISDEALYQESSELINLLERDLNELSVFGIDQTTIEGFTAKVSEFGKVEYDMTVLNKQKQASVEKAEAAEKMRDKLLQLQLKSDLAYKAGVVKFRLVDLGGVSVHNLDKLRAVAEGYLQLLASEVENLNSFGLTTQDLTDLELLTESFNTAKNEQFVISCLRNISTQKRREMGNALFTEYSKYCNLGRQMWAATDPVKSKHYTMQSTAEEIAEPDDTGGSEEIAPEELIFS